MRVLLSWLREHVDIPASATGRDVAERLIAIGHEVEGVHALSDVVGEVVVGHVLSFVAEPQRNGKTIRWCQVLTSPGAQPRGIVCGAHNFAEGDKVAVALPGTTLPGGFTIAARKTYGHLSDGMICSAPELGAGTASDGIVTLDEDAPVGADALALLGLRDDVLDIAVTPDRGYCMSVRGLARELATAYGLDFRDPAMLSLEAPDGLGWPVLVDDPGACDRFVTRTVEGLDPEAVTPQWMKQRLQAAGMRSLSLAVDITNYVLLELGQPLHGYDRDRLQGTLVVRRATAGEKLLTLDGVTRALSTDDLVICDDSGPLSLAGVMGGESTELSAASTAVVIESAHFAPQVVGRTLRRHHLPSEGSRRFERGVDIALAPAAAQRAVDLLVELAGGRALPHSTDVDTTSPREPFAMPTDLASRIAGVDYDSDTVQRRLREVGCTIATSGQEIVVTPPSWRPDLQAPIDAVEEVIRLEGFAAIPSVLPTPVAGRGLTTRQSLLRAVGRALASSGYVEAPSSPFMGAAAFDALGLPADDARRHACRLANPLSESEPLLRTTLLPGLLATLRRNIGRGCADVALFETGLVTRPGPHPLPAPPRLGADRRPTADELLALDAALPRQPRRVAVVLAGQRELPGWWGAGRPSTWADAVAAAHTVALAYGTALEVAAATHAPWHPGRCAALSLDGVVVGHAGELHPRALSALGLPERTCAMELELDALVARSEPVTAPRLSTFPPAVVDVALTVDLRHPAATVEAALRAGAGALLESLELFDDYRGPGVQPGSRSLGFRLVLRAPDRTLTTDDVMGVRDAAVAAAAEATGALLRS